ncbi:hypothetical protein AVEN_157936-1 [Araneus ventricosus]|uniref:Uncharacterized protein n=1 Tax=Araneus ventricosus TaxID=182803 RepID=A0A4Y2H9B6_ARAVE|nr:hypothetical protein AVEN_157936-1 [Araneus ventricosus]
MVRATGLGSVVSRDRIRGCVRTLFALVCNEFDATSLWQVRLVETKQQVDKEVEITMEEAREEETMEVALLQIAQHSVV